MYAIRNTQTGKWFHNSMGKQWHDKLDRESPFYTKRAAELAIRIHSLGPCEIVPVEIVPVEKKR